jgi:hypothetical protein
MVIIDNYTIAKDNITKSLSNIHHIIYIYIYIVELQIKGKANSIRLQRSLTSNR